MNLAADIDTFFADFGIPATYTPKSGVAKPVTVIFDDEGTTAANVDTTSPQLLSKDIECPAVAQGDEFTINEKPYRVTKRIPDGTGISEVKLMRM